MNIAVIAAPQTFGVNTGMYSVDLAAWYFFRKYFPQANVRFFTLYSSPGDFGGTPFVYEKRSEFFAWENECDVVIYWGDFLHGWSYRQEMLHWLAKLEPDLSSVAVQQIVRHFLYRIQSSDSDCPKKILLYGGTLLFNRWLDCQDEEYSVDLRLLLAQAAGVWMREPFSTATVNYLTGSYGFSQGTDCALFLDRDVFRATKPMLSLSKEREPGDNRRIGLFLGRSQFDTGKVSSLLQALGSGLGANTCWLNWGQPPFFLDRKQSFLEANPEMSQFPEENEPLAILHALAQFDVVVSDTYHVCVNAWNFGIPAICLLDDENSALSVNTGSQEGRDKRVVFYWQYNLSSFLVYSSGLTHQDQQQAKLSSLLNALQDKATLSLALQSIRMHAGACEHQLSDVISGWSE